MTPFQLSDAFIERLGWVLLHSVWQFALIALIAMVLERTTRRLSARVRYGVFLMTFGAMAVAPAATWLVIPNESKLAEAPEVSNETGGRQAQLDEPAPLNATMPVSEPMAVAPKKPAPSPMPIDTTQPEEQVPVSPAGSDIPFWKSMEQGLRPWLAYLVIGWGLGVCVFALRPILSWRRVRRLRTVGVSAPPEAVQQLLERTAKRLHLRQAVQILQSTLVQSAVVVGYFRPVILLPVSAITGLSPAQLEAILAHELAHIRRHDYLVNVLQTLIETVFFYHPAIWWLSNRIRTERENCCDDIAVAMLGDRVEYGRALLALEECRTGETALAVGAQGGSLLARVRRLLGNVPPGRAFSGGSIVGLGLLAAVAIAIGIWAANGLGESDADALAQEPAKVKKEGIIVKAAGSHTHDVALSPDGKILARAGTRTTELWDVVSGKKLHTLKGQPHFYKVAFSPDGKTLASITGDVAADKFEVEVKLWDVATGKERPLNGHRSGVYSLAFSADGKTLATFHLDPGAVRLWDVATGKEKMKLDAPGTALAFSPDGKTLAMVGDGVQLWDLTTGKKRISMPETRHVSISLAFTPDGKTLVSAGRTKEEGQEELCQLKVWDVATARERATIALPEFDAMLSIPLVFSADGRTLITAGWIIEKDKETKEPMWHDSHLVGRVSVQHLDLATGKARATFWTPVNPGGTHEFSGNVVGIYFAALSADGKTVAWGGAEGDDKTITGTAHVWEVESLATSPPKIPKEIEEKNKEAAEHNQDIEALNGTWKLRAVEMNGRRKDPKHLQTQMHINWGVLESDTPEGHNLATFRIDVSRRPKTIDIFYSGYTDSKGKFAERKNTVKAIYLLEGDRLTICKSANDTEARPTEFKTQPDDGLTLEIYERAPPPPPDPYALPTFIKPGETKTVTLGYSGAGGGPVRWENYGQEFTLTFADTDVPKGVTFEPANPVVKNRGEVAKFTIRAAQDAALGDFAIGVRANVKGDGFSDYELKLSVDPAGEAARPQPGKPRRRYHHLSSDQFMTHDGKLLSIADGKLIMKSKDGTEHSYTLADKFGSDKYAWQITYNNSGYTVEELKARQADPATPVIVRVTARKDKPQEPTHIEAGPSYDAFMAEHYERQRQEKEQQDIEREKREIVRQKKVQQEIDHLQGTWLVVSSQTGEEKEPLESLKKQRVIIKGDHLTLAFGNERNEKRAGTIKIDPQAKSLDWVTPMAGDAAMKAIYELKADDLKIGFGVDGLLRPTRFEMGQDQVGWLLVLKREKP